MIVLYLTRGRGWAMLTAKKLIMSAAFVLPLLRGCEQIIGSAWRGVRELGISHSESGCDVRPTSKLISRRMCCQPLAYVLLLTLSFQHKLHHSNICLIGFLPGSYNIRSIPKASSASTRLPRQYLLIMNACQTCSGFFHIAVSPQDEFPAYERDLNINERREIEHSAQNCELCRLILSGLGEYSKLEDYDQGADHLLDRCGAQLSIKTWTHLSQFKVDKKRITSFSWELLINGMRTSGLPRCYCYVWADQCM